MIVPPVKYSVPNMLFARVDAQLLKIRFLLTSPSPFNTISSLSILYNLGQFWHGHVGAHICSALLQV